MISQLIQNVQSLTNYSPIILFLLVLFFIFKPKLNILIFPIISDYIKQILCTKTKREALKKSREKLEINSDYQQIQGHINFRRRASFEAYDDEQEQKMNFHAPRLYSDQPSFLKSSSNPSGTFFNRFRHQGNQSVDNQGSNYVPFQMTRRQINQTTTENTPPVAGQDSNPQQTDANSEPVNKNEVLKTENKQEQQIVFKSIKDPKFKSLNKKKENEGELENSNARRIKKRANNDKLDEKSSSSDDENQEDRNNDNDDGDDEENDPLRFLDEIQRHNRVLNQHIDMVKCNIALESAISRENYDLGRKIFLIVVDHFREELVQEKKEHHHVKSIPILTYTLYLNLLQKQLSSIPISKQEQVAKISNSLKSSIISEAHNLFDQVYNNPNTKSELNNVFFNYYIKIVFFDPLNINSTNMKKIIEATHETSIFLDQVTLNTILKALTKISSDAQLIETHNDNFGPVHIIIQMVHAIVEEYLLDEKQIQSYEEKYIQLFSNIAVTLNQMNLQEAAFSVLRLMKKFKVKSSLMPYQVIVKAAAQQQKFKLALDIMRSVLQDRIDPTTIFFNDVMNACYKANQFAEIIQTYQLMTLKINCRPDVLSYSFYIRALIRMKESGKGLSFFYDLIEKPDEIHFDTIFFNNIIQDLNEMDLYDEACKVFEWLVQSQKYCPSTVTYNIMIMIYGNIKEYEKGWGLYRSLQNQDYQLLPTINTYINLLQICAQTHDFNSMVLLYKEVIEDVYSDNSVFGLRLNNNFFYSFIQRLTESQVLEHNLITLEACFQSLKTKNIVKAYIYVNFFDQLTQILEQEKNNYQLKEFCQNLLVGTFAFIKELNKEQMYLPKELHTRLCALNSQFQNNKNLKENSTNFKPFNNNKFPYQKKNFQERTIIQPVYEREISFD